MADTITVKNYVAQWLQLGKCLEFCDRPVCLPNVRNLHGYSEDFEKLWSDLTATPSQAYLENCGQTIADLLSPSWDIDSCPRCDVLIPTPIHNYGFYTPCPCADLPLQPNLQLVMPHPPVDAQTSLSRIADRLRE